MRVELDLQASREIQPGWNLLNPNGGRIDFIGFLRSS